MNFQVISKVILEGLAVAIAAFFIPKKQMGLENIFAIGLSAAAIFLILDQFSPEIGLNARRGAGFGIGLDQVGWGPTDLTGGFEDCKIQCKKNPTSCSKPGPCHRGGSTASDSYLQDSIEVGTDVSGRLVKYRSHCKDFYIAEDKDKKRQECLVPYDVDNLIEPRGMRSLPPQWSQTDIEGRKMNFDESNCPVNINTNEFKLVPGLHSKYVLQPGYNENVQGFNENDRFQDANWKTNNPLDLHHYRPT